MNTNSELYIIIKIQDTLGKLTEYFNICILQWNLPALLQI